MFVFAANLGTKSLATLAAETYVSPPTRSVSDRHPYAPHTCMNQACLYVAYATTSIVCRYICIYIYIYKKKQRAREPDPTSEGAHAVYGTVPVPVPVPFPLAASLTNYLASQLPGQLAAWLAR